MYIVCATSSWRFWAGGLDAVQDMWRIKNFPGTIIDITPDCGDRDVYVHIKRGKEIKLWLDKNPVDRFLIIDTTDTMLPELIPNFIRTRHDNGGLTSEHVTTAISILSNNI